MRRGDLMLHRLYRLLAETEGEGDDEHSEFGVHITYADLYATVVFLACIYVSGQIASRLLKMPNLVGEIICGILLGPPLADYVPNPEAFVLIGEVGLILLVVEAGIDIDLSTLKLVGTRGFLIALVGSLLPIAIGMFLAWMMKIGETTAIIAAGAVFGPTSLGIALNILKGGGVLNTPVGQMIVSAAVIDDMIALVVLSQLEALVGEITVVGIIIPIISALLFLILGGYLCIFVVPGFIDKYILARFDENHHDKIELALLFGILLALMPATHFAKASYLMGSFLAGLIFCSSDGLHHLFVRQFKRLLQWLMRIFFAASIGFQVPIKDFADVTVIWQGLLFCLALLGKIGVGFMVPNFSQARRFTANHLRDCLVTGFSMAAEGEFAFVIAVFSVDVGLIGKDLYASVVLAVLISTIIPPFCLRFTISYYNKKGEEAVAKAAEEELRKHDTGVTESKTDDDLVAGIKNHTDVFLVIQTQSESKWGLLIKIMNVMGKKGLDVIDHRAWSPRGINTTLVNEVYARCSLKVEESQTSKEAIDALMEDIKKSIEDIINQPEAKVKVQRWYPGVVEEIVEEVNEKRQRNINVRQRLLSEAAQNLERKQKMQTEATKEKTVAELLGESGPEAPQDVESGKGDVSVGIGVAPTEVPSAKPRRRVRQKMRSTPVVGGGLFGESIQARSGRDGDSRYRVSDLNAPKRDDLSSWSNIKAAGVPAEITVNGEVYSIRISRDTLQNLKKGFSNSTDSRGIPISGIEITAKDDAPVTQRLQGFVRNTPLGQIQEEHDGVSEMSETSSHQVDPNAQTKDL
ncbi:Kef-type K+ transport system, membrane component [Nitzschia inconspicua]|uniref:Kef-type K+ transport system, membrane component n=1 Tax=Nitzschia inconspicua TaxID=303405 RepID=A0A9K3Q1C3_9STRA|nr:Kef-type K+ transport system, membrane component [Nitzschia inconspicua]